MLKRVAVLAVLVVSLATTACSSCGGCGSGAYAGGGFLHCEPPCYGRAYHRAARQMMDFVDVYFLNYDKHDPFRCDVCVGD
jgi:hypothetical protein